MHIPHHSTSGLLRYNWQWVYTHFRPFLGLMFSPETTIKKALNIGDIRGFSSVISEQNPRPKNRKNGRKWVYMRIFCQIFILLLCGCNKNNRVHLDGERENITFVQKKPLHADHLDTVPVLLPDVKTQTTWPHAGGYSNVDDAHHTLNFPLQKLWSTDVSGGQSKILSLPVGDEEALYVLNGLNQVLKIDQKTGKKVWICSLSAVEYALGGGVCLDEEYIFVGTSAGEAACLNKTTGQIQWKRTLFSPFRGQPLSGGDKVFFLNINNKLFALDRNTGKTLWSHSGSPEHTALLGTASVQLAQGSVIVPYSSGEVFALEQDTGRQQWVKNLISRNRNTHIKAQPLVDDEMIYLVGSGDVFMAIDKASGEIRWQCILGSGTTPVQGINVIFLVTTDNNLVCIYKKTGQIKWTKTLKHPEGKVFDTSQPEDIERMDVKDEQADTLTWSAPLLAGQKIILMSSDGVVCFFNPINGMLKNIIKLPYDFPIGGIVVHNALYILTQTGYLLSYVP